MYHAWITTFARAVASIAAVTSVVLFGAPAVAQVPGWNAFTGPTYGTMPSDTYRRAPEMAPNSPLSPATGRGPLARLVSNPNTSSGLPPFALADQSGAIQRYVEPVPGVDLQAYVGQVVVVRHDTGRTLLASQLELPPKPLYPMISDSRTGAAPQDVIRQAQYADKDDATVELLEDGEQMPNGNDNSNAMTHPTPTPDGTMYPDGGYPVFPNESMMLGELGIGPPGCDPSHCDPYGMNWMPTEYGGGPCPHCGGYHQQPFSGSEMPFSRILGPGSRGPSHVFADIEINFLRLHLVEEAAGKLSEKYEFSPRFILGFRDLGPVDGRIRYWTYGRTTAALVDDDEESIRFEFDVLDIEGTHKFCGKRTEVVLAAGVRLAGIDVREDDDGEAGTDLLGLTMAADGRTRLTSLGSDRLAWVYGGRLSILGGDWGHDDDEESILDERVRDDNVIVHELYAGLEVARCYNGLDLHARLAFEMQNWHSDVLAESELDTDTIGIVGPGLRLGAEF
jgi:hypothetical protein